MIKKNLFILFLVLSAFVLAGGVFLWPILGPRITTLKPPTAGPTAEQLKGCRSPIEPGCSKCLEIKGGSRCTIRSWFSPSGESKNVPWYNGAVVCESNVSDVPMCAMCLEREQEEFKKLQQSEDFKRCGCSNRSKNIVLDACLVSNSCDCLCERYSSLSASCGG